MHTPLCCNPSDQRALTQIKGVISFHPGAKKPRATVLHFKASVWVCYTFQLQSLMHSNLEESNSNFTISQHHRISSGLDQMINIVRKVDISFFSFSFCRVGLFPPEVCIHIPLCHIYIPQGALTFYMREWNGRKRAKKSLHPSPKTSTFVWLMSPSQTISTMERLPIQIKCLWKWRTACWEKRRDCTASVDPGHES